MRRALELGAFVEIPIVVVGALFVAVLRHAGEILPGALSGGDISIYGGDFAIFRHAGTAVLNGHSPYVAPTVELLRTQNRFVYPMPFSLPFVPLALIPERVAICLFFVMSVGAVVLALRLLGVRDLRCFGIAVVGVPVLQSLTLGAVGPWLLLLAALGWRYRDRSVAGVPLALAAAAKLFLWPLLIWLVVTRRTRGALTAAMTLAVIVAAWLVLDPSGMRHYPETLRVLDSVQRPKSYSIGGLLTAFGAPGAVGTAVLVTLSIAGIFWLRAIARGRGDRSAFAAAIVVALATTPILWLHYLVLLLVPIALAQPSLAAAWFLPVLLWTTGQAGGAVWRIGIALAAIAVAAAIGRTRPGRHTEPTHRLGRVPAIATLTRSPGP